MPDVGVGDGQMVMEIFEGLEKLKVIVPITNRVPVSFRNGYWQLNRSFQRNEHAGDLGVDSGPQARSRGWEHDGTKLEG